MPITPIEIRKKQFQKKLRGYDTKEVDHFLSILADEWKKNW